MKTKDEIQSKYEFLKSILKDASTMYVSTEKIQAQLKILSWVLSEDDEQ